MLIVLGVGGFGAWWYFKQTSMLKPTPIKIDDPVALSALAEKTPALKVTQALTCLKLSTDYRCNAIGVFSNWGTMGDNYRSTH